MISLRKVGLKDVALGAKWVESCNKWVAFTPRCCQSSANFPPNDTLEPKIVTNRNPRNLEKLRIGEKPMGWNLDNPGKSYWNKVTLDVSGKHVTASVKHFEGHTPVRASTQEWCIKKHLYSTRDTAAVETVGRVLAQRCLQTGLGEVHCYFTEEQMSKEKIKVFIKALEDGGLTLKEPDQLERQEFVHLNYPRIQEKAWEVFEELDEKVLSKVPNKEIG